MFADDYTYQQPQPSSSSSIPTSNCNDNDINNSPSFSSSWKSLKKEGTNHYHNSKYENALVCFQQAFQKLQIQNQNNNDTNERNEDSNDNIIIPIDFKRECAILLSNSVVCRLKIGGTEMIMLAVEEAKQVSYKFLALQFVALVFTKKYVLLSN